MMLTIYGACAVTFMMLMYAFERRGPQFVLAFAAGCALSSSYGFFAGTWPFGVVEAIWSVIAVKRYVDLRRLEPDRITTDTGGAPEAAGPGDRFF